MCNPYVVSKITLLSSLVKIILTFQVINITSLLLQAGWLHTAKLETSIFQYTAGPVVSLKYLNLKNHSANYDENCELYSKEVLVNEINGIINSGKFSRSYDYLYLVVSFLGPTV